LLDLIVSLTLGRSERRPFIFVKKIKASTSHRTATTAYPCYGQVLGDLTGAGRVRLAGRKDKMLNVNSQMNTLFLEKKIKWRLLDSYFLIKK